MSPQVYFRVIVLAFFSAAMCGLNPQAVAGILKIQTQTTVKPVAGDLLTVSIRVINKGTAPAQNVQVHLIVLDVQQDGPVRPWIGQGESDTVVFQKNIAGIMKGRYPLTVQVDFHDANLYPFSALSGRTFYYKEDVNPDLVCVLPDITLESTGELDAILKNLASGPLKIQSSLVLPKEFSTQRPQIDLEIEPRAEKTVPFQVVNFSALPGASYPAFCYFEYDLKDTHYTAVARAIIKVAKKENLFRRARWLWVALIGILSVCLIVILVKHRTHTRNV